MELPRDPWDAQYQFYAGPHPRLRDPSVLPMPWRSYRLALSGDEEDTYVYDGAARTEADRIARGNPKPDGQPGFPAPIDLSVYIYSMGSDGMSNQLLYGGDGGDDINSWDTANGWAGFY